MADTTQGIKGTFADQSGVSYQFNVPSGGTIAKGTQVELGAADLEVKKVATLGTTNYVGYVIAGPGTTKADGKVTVMTRFRYIVENGVAGAAIAAPGPVVFDADGKIIAYDDQTHDSAAIVGFNLDTPAAEDDLVIFGVL